MPSFHTVTFSLSHPPLPLYRGISKTLVILRKIVVETSCVADSFISSKIIQDSQLRRSLKIKNVSPPTSEQLLQFQIVHFCLYSISVQVDREMHLASSHSGR